MDDTFTSEHTRVAAILAVQWQRAMNRDAMLIRTKYAREAINAVTIDLAVMYRDMDSTFDFPRFLREARQGAE